MTDEERDLIARFIQRVGGGAGSSGGFGSVPSTAPALPPIDKDADAHIGALFTQYPEARYRITQLAYVQEQALAASQQRIEALQAELQRVRQGQGQPGSAWNQGGQQPPQQRGFFGSLFGGGNQQPAPPPPQQYAPPPQAYAPPPGYGPPPQSGGTGFLGSALRTAAGVAGGVVAGEALMNLFSGRHDYGMGGGYGAPAGFVPEQAIVPDPGFGGGPWGGQPAPAVDPFDQGGAMKDTSDAGWSGPPTQDQGWVDTSAQDQGGGWTDTSDSGGGWTDTSDSGGGWTDTSDTN